MGSGVGVFTLPPRDCGRPTSRGEDAAGGSSGEADVLVQAVTLLLLFERLRKNRRK